ncbi:MAG: nicotinamidase [Betaproteobacteria bacterium SG8_39]|nr:MAG: nicotinamidase [Betaproteobacteria bacterium SG8_39]
MSDACLVMVDIQNDFMPGGALAVPQGDAIVAIVNRLAARFQWVVAAQDWHPARHASFASSHAGKKPFETTRLSYGEQVLWPDHCVQGTEGAAFHRDLSLTGVQLIVRKGYRPDVDSYSVFVEADRRTSTGLAGWLREVGIRRLWFVGLATDFCVLWSALDARAAGFEATVIEDACRAIDLNGSLDAAWKEMHAAGVKRTRSDALQV